MHTRIDGSKFKREIQLGLTCRSAFRLHISVSRLIATIAKWFGHYEIFVSGGVV
jgi:hypothetical protein